MALREEDVYRKSARTAQPAKRSRITFDVSPELRRRIKIAALENNLSIGEYLGSILEQTVPDEISTAEYEWQPITRETLEHIYRVREEIMKNTGGRLFEDSTEMIRQMREERSQELEQL